jgi:alpha-L-arabinofuranosidase
MRVVAANMKLIYSFFFLFSAVVVSGQTTVTVDAANVLRTLTGKENGINLNYLMDGTYLSPAISTTQSLKNVKAKLLRYPGGEKSDNYLFSAAPYASSSPRMALLDTCFWPSNDFKFVDTNTSGLLCRPQVLDFDEYIEMCNNVGASPLVVVAYDAAYNNRVCGGKPTKPQLLKNAVEWVRYANVKKGYGVKYWMIGNESWNDAGYNGKVTASKYADDLDDFATAMKEVDPTIKIIANGRSGWWQTILQSRAVSKIDFLGFSEYPVFNYSGGYDYYHNNDVSLTAEVDLAIEDINTYAASPHKSRIKVIATEYSSIDWGNAWPSNNNLGHALVNFQMFGDMVVKPKLEAACMWNTRWVQNALPSQSLYDAFDSQGNQNAVAMCIDAWGSNLLSDMVKVTNNGNRIKSYASYNDTEKKLNIFLLNKDYSPQQVNLAIDNYVHDFNGSVWRLHGTSVNDKFPEFAKTDSIFEPVDVSSLTLPPNSVTILKLHKDDVALPVRLINFEALEKDSGIELQWETTGEEDLDEYIIERSNDGEIFTAIANVAAKNLDSSSYEYTDTKFANTNTLHYRLAVVNTEGSRVSSRVVSVTINAFLQKINVQPNPFEGSLLIRVKSEAEKKITIMMIDVSGKVAFRQQQFLYKGNNAIELNNLDRLMKGLYLIKMGDDEFATTFKVMKK